MDYTTEQLIVALQSEYESLLVEMPMEEGEDGFTLEEHLEWITKMSYDELVKETGTYEEEDLEVFMEQYGG